MRTRIRQRDVQYVVQDGCLVRTVTAGSGDGRAYRHRCMKSTLEKVAHAIGATPFDGVGTTGERIVREEDLPFTQVHVAMGFLKERGIVDVRHRRFYPVSQDAYLDAMIEFYALAEESKRA
ncbi:MAG: hypothetical protein IH897_08795 [Planctomycetes bacterium]|nr:hypothetical protein [Planctomycetota bacterium]